MNFLSRVAGLSLRNRVRSLDILRNSEPLLIRIERSQLSWFKHKNWETTPRADPELAGGIICVSLAWDHLRKPRTSRKVLRDVWTAVLSLLPHSSPQIK